jgi:hypothetical protein
MRRAGKRSRIEKKWKGFASSELVQRFPVIHPVKIGDWPCKVSGSIGPAIFFIHAFPSFIEKECYDLITHWYLPLMETFVALPR